MMNSRTKSTFVLVGAMMAFFSVIAVVVAKKSSEMLVGEATSSVKGEAKQAIAKIDRMMAGVQAVIENQRWNVTDHIDDPDYMFHITDGIAVHNEDIYGSCLAFEPYFFKSKGLYWAPYTCVTTDGVKKRELLGSADYRYHEEWEWYTVARKSGKPHWSEPYFDEVGGKMLMCTYSVPVYDAKTNICGILTADVTLKQLTDQVSSIHPFPHSYAVMKSKRGAVLVAPPEGEKQDADTISVSEKAENGWTVEIVCPVNEIVRGSREMVSRIICFSILGLSLIFILSRFFSKRLEQETEMRERLSQERILGEINTARKIQSDLVPHTFLDNVWAVLQPAKEVGGDIYDFCRKDNRLYFIVGDASGKGVPAALFSFMAGTVFRMACDLGLNPNEIVGRINAALSYNNEMCMFVTAFVGALDLETGFLEFSSAGHNPPVIIKPDGTAVFLEVRRGLPTGVMPGTSYALQSVRLEPGSKIIVYTDGVTEAERADRLQYGNERLLDFATKNADRCVRDLVSELMKSVDQFVVGAAQSDDITIMAIRS